MAGHLFDGWWNPPACYAELLWPHCCVAQFTNLLPNSVAAFLCVCVYREHTWDSKVNVFHVSKLFWKRKKEFGVSWPEGIRKKTLAKGILANGYTNSWYYGSPTESVLECVNWKKKKKSTPWKLRIIIYLVDKTEDISPEGNPSGHSERLLQRGKAGATVYGSFCSKDQVVETSKDYCWRKPIKPAL